SSRDPRRGLWTKAREFFCSLCRRNCEIQPAIFIRLLRSWDIKLVQRNFSCPLFAEDPNRVSHDRVILYFFAMLIFKNQHGQACRLGFGGSYGCCWSWRSLGNSGPCIPLLA